MKVTNEIGLFTKLSLSLAKQRTDAEAKTSNATTSSSNFSLKSIEDKIDISSSFKPRSDVQTLTSEMTGKRFSSIKEYGAYFLEAYNKIKADRS